MSVTSLLLLLQTLSVLGSVFQAPFDTTGVHEDSEWTTFSRPIKRVAVIGAGPAGLQSVAALKEQNLTVRLFERDAVPGGNWRYSDQTPVRESYPDKPLHLGAYTPDIRPAGSVEWYEDGDDGLSLDERWREHSRPSPIWNTLHTNSPSAVTGLPDVPYPPDTPWIISARLIERHVRSFASIHGINSNDKPSSITSYSTRVEYAHKEGDVWTLHLRKLEHVPHLQKIRAEWWTEQFDAVVVAIDWDAVHVPDIKGLAEPWSLVKENGKYSVWHSVSYRRPEPFANKTILIVGASTSAGEISRDIGPHVKKVYISIRDTEPSERRAIFNLRVYHDAEHIPEIEEFQPLESLTEGIQKGHILLRNGSVITGIDEVILATGIKRSFPFLRDYIGNATTPNDLSNKTLPHILSEDIKGWQALHWTGHYIPDPTLAIANVRPWTTGRYQALGFAKVWKGTARIPNEKKLWELYKGPGNEFFGNGLYGTPAQEMRARYFVTWLNSESLVFGGRFVDALPLEWREVWNYYMDSKLRGIFPWSNFTGLENRPASEWDEKYLGSDAVVEELPW